MFLAQHFFVCFNFHSFIHSIFCLPWSIRCTGFHRTRLSVPTVPSRNWWAMPSCQSTSCSPAWSPFLEQTSSSNGTPCLHKNKTKTNKRYQLTSAMQELFVFSPLLKNMLENIMMLKCTRFENSGHCIRSWRCEAEADQKSSSGHVHEPSLSFVWINGPMEPSAHSNVCGVRNMLLRRAEKRRKERYLRILEHRFNRTEYGVACAEGSEPFEHVSKPWNVNDRVLKAFWFDYNIT